MSVIRTLIVDDEELCRRGVRLMLADDPSFEIVGECGDGERAVQDIGRLRPDLVFLDIRMPRGSGFDVVRRMPTGEIPIVVFVTAFDDYAIRAFEVHAVDYVLKPFVRRRFRTAMEHVKAKHRDRQASSLGVAMMQMIGDWDRHTITGTAETAPTDYRYLAYVKVADRGGETVLRTGDIEWIEGADYYVNLHTRERSYLHRERLKNLERQLSPLQFVRVHKSAIVNIARVARVVADAGERDHAVMQSGATVPVSRLRRAALLVSLEARRADESVSRR